MIPLLSGPQKQGAIVAQAIHRLPEAAIATRGQGVHVVLLQRQQSGPLLRHALQDPRAPGIPGARLHVDPVERPIELQALLLVQKLLHDTQEGLAAIQRHGILDLITTG